MNKVSFSIVKRHPESFARVGKLSTPNGEIETPAFTPVGTRASVRGLTPDDLVGCGSQAVLANTYHLMLSPGVEVIKKFGGFANFMGFSGPTFTDSGGYQVSFLWDPKGGSKKVKIDDEGAVFRSHIDGTKVFISPEISMEVQAVLGADVIMSFDQPVGNSMTTKRRKEAYVRSLEWEKRSLIKWKEIQKTRANKQALYGVIQGETAQERQFFLKELSKLDFMGIALGGQSIGANIPQTIQAIMSTAPLLADLQLPVHALGLGGGVWGILNAVRGGVDTFDNTSITRMARTGVLFIYPEDGGNAQNKFMIDIAKAKYAFEMGPVSSLCECLLCKNFSRAYIRHLLISKEPLAVRLTTLHNVTFINRLMGDIRRSLLEDKFESLVDYFEAKI